MERFILKNDDRKYLGLTPVEEHWESLDIKNVTVFFDGDIIRKMIRYSYSEYQDFTYFECDVFVETSENRSMVLPKREKAKPKKLNYTATTKFSPIGVYLRYDGGNLTIGNFTTQKTYFYSCITEEKPYKAKFDSWLNDWKNDATEADLMDMEEFRLEKRKKQKYKEGDIFCFKRNRREYGFGKIVIDVVKRRKETSFKENKNYGLDNLMGTALIVKIYHKISDSKEIDVVELDKLDSFPLQPMLDNKIYYNEYQIIGHSSVTSKDFDEAIISVGPSISAKDEDIAYLQYGLIYKEIPLSKYEKYAKKHWKNYRNEALGFSFFIDNFEACIEEKSNKPYFDINIYDLRNPDNKKDREEIFKLFELDASLDYEANSTL